MSRINMTDDADTLAKKIRKAKTDAEPLPSEAAGLEGRPEAKNLITIYAALTDIPVADILAEHGGTQFSGFKQALTDVVVEKLAPITSEMTRLKADNAYIDAALAKGADRADAIAQPILREVKEIVGFLNR